MERFAPLLLDIWREVGRHIEIGEAVQRCTPPARAPRARRPGARAPLDVAAREPRDGRLFARFRTATSPRTRATRWLPPRCGSWSRSAGRGTPLRGSASGVRRRLPERCPSHSTATCSSGRSCATTSPPGLLILVARPPRHFEREHEDVARALVEPFAVAFGNDQRIAELEALRRNRRGGQSLLSRDPRGEPSEQAAIVRLGGAAQRFELCDPLVVPERNRERLDQRARDVLVLALEVSRWPRHQDQQGGGSS